MRIFKHRIFHQWAKSEGLADSILKNAVLDMGETGIRNMIDNGKLFEVK